MITKEVKEYIDSILSVIERQYALDYARYRDGMNMPAKPKSMSPETAKAIAKKIDKLWPQGAQFDETSHYRAYSMISYKGAFYVASSEKKPKPRGVQKGIFTSPAAAWKWAKEKIEAGELVVFDAVGARSEDEIPLYSSSAEDGQAMKRIVTLHMKGGEGRRYKDLIVVKSPKDLEG